jgi:hypothetical protein
MLLLGLFTCLFLALTCLPIVFSVGLMVTQRVDMALAAQNAAFAGTSETDQNASVINLREADAASVATQVLAGNLKAPVQFGSGPGRYEATITVHDPMDSGTRILVDESKQANPACDVAPSTPIGGSPAGVRWLHDTGNCWRDDVVLAYHRSPGLTVYLTGGVTVCSPLMTAIAIGHAGGCVELVRMNTRGYADMSTENPAPTELVVSVHGPLSNDPELQSGIARFSWQSNGVIELGSGETVTCRLINAGSDTVARTASNCGAASGEATFTNLPGGHYRFEVNISYQSETGPVSKTGAGSVTIPAGSSSGYAHINQSPPASSLLDWDVTGAGTVHCWLYSKSGHFASEIEYPAHPAGAEVPCDSYKGKPAPLTPAQSSYLFTVAIPGQIPSRVSWYTGAPPHTTSVHYHVSVSSGAVSPRPTVLTFTWDDSDLQGTSAEMRQIVDPSLTVCALERTKVGNTDYAPVPVSTYSGCADRGQFTTSGSHELTYSDTIPLDAGYSYRFSVQVAAKSRQPTQAPANSFSIASIPVLTWSNDGSNALENDGLHWRWTVDTGAPYGDFQPAQSTCRLASYVTVTVDRRITATGTPDVISSVCAAAGDISVPQAQLAADRIYCYRINPGKVSNGGSFTAGRGYLYRPDNNPVVQEAACPAG